MAIGVHTPVEPASSASAIQAAIHSVDNDEPVYHVSTMNDVVAASVSPQRMRMVLVALFALVAVTLSCVGIYGVISYSVERRPNEIGIRLALAAARAQVMVMSV